MENQIKVSVEDGIKELVIREGAALEVFNPEKVKISGVLTAAKDYWSVRNTEHQKENCHVLYSIDRLFVNLICEEKYKLGTEIYGSLIANPDLDGLGINKQKEYTLTDLSRKLKFMRSYFKDVDKYSVLLGNLTKFKASVQSQIDKETSERGNKADNFNVQVITNLDLDFAMSIPLYKGQKKTDFKVEICFEVREKNISVWLESVELKDAQREQSEKLIGDLINYFQGEGLVTIEV